MRQTIGGPDLRASRYCETNSQGIRGSGRLEEALRICFLGPKPRLAPANQVIADLPG